MSKFKKGQSGNPNGRPKGTKNANTPAGRLERALKNGYDLVDLKRLIIDLISDPNTKMTPAQIERLIKTAVDTELKLLEMDYKYNNKESDEKLEDDLEEVVFKTTMD